MLQLHNQKFSSQKNKCIFFNSGTIANKIMNIPVWIDLPAEIASKKI